jgi:hypothetical protein
MVPSMTVSETVWRDARTDSSSRLVTDVCETVLPGTSYEIGDTGCITYVAYI